MKKLLSLIISVMLVIGIFTSLPLSSIAAAKRVSLKKTSAVLKISKKNGKNVYGSTAIKVTKAKGVTVKKVTYKSSNKRVAAVTSKGKVTAKNKGIAKISVKVKYKFKKRTYTKNLSFKVTVKDVRPTPTSPTSPTSPTQATEATKPTEPVESESTKKLNTVSEITENTENFEDKSFLKKLSEFSNKLYEMSAADESGNYTMSPASVYMALAMLYSIGDEGVKSDIQTLVNMDDSDLNKTGKLFKYLTKKYTYCGQTVSTLKLTNSIWLNSGLEANQNVLDSLADNYYCHAYETPFRDNNTEANRAIKEFINQQTNGLINQNFDIPADTLFALINTLYFKDVWDVEREELSTEQRKFTTQNGDVQREFIIGKYIDGQIQETDSSYYFHTTTNAGYKAKFILPKAGHTLKEAMSAENLNNINQDSEFDVYDSSNKKHLTRCIFPSFKVESDTKLKEVLAKNNLLPNAFSLYYSPLVPNPLQVSDIKHRVVVDVSKTGIEGAAVTIIISKEGAVYDPDPKVYHDFVLDKNFGFIITDKNDVVLFEGQITNPK